MRHSEFWELVDAVFGRQLGRTLVSDQVLGGLADRTAEQALEAGEEPVTVWRAMCEAMDVPQSQRFGPEVPRRGRPLSPR